MKNRYETELLESLNYLDSVLKRNEVNERLIPPSLRRLARYGRRYRKQLIRDARILDATRELVRSIVEIAAFVIFIAVAYKGLMITGFLVCMNSI